MTEDYKIVIDSREKNLLWKPDKNHIVAKLDTGDYSIFGYEDKISIERKSAMDLVGTLTKGHDRFKRELLRAKELEYFAIVIECSYSALLNKTYPNAYKSKVPGHVILAILNTIHMKYDVPIFFMNSRIECQRLIKGLFNSFIKQKRLEEKGNDAQN